MGLSGLCYGAAAAAAAELAATDTFVGLLLAAIEVLDDSFSLAWEAFF